MSSKIEIYKAWFGLKLSHKIFSWDDFDVKITTEMGIK